MPRASIPTRTLGGAWSTPRRRAARQGDVLTREQIVRAAVDLIDRSGLAGLSMRQVARELAVGVTTLYWHVADKDQLLELVCDEVLGEVELPSASTGDWSTELLHVMSELRQIFLRHRDLATLLPTRDNVGPNALRVREFAAASLMRAGLPAPLLPVADHALLSYVLGFVAGEVGATAAALERGIDVAAAPADEARFLAALPASQYPGLVALASNGNPPDRDESFTLGLKLLLAGIAAHVPARRGLRGEGARVGRKPTVA